jgi:hypothetical protein
MNKLRTKGTHRRKTEPEIIQPEVVMDSDAVESPDASWQLLYASSGLPTWEGSPNREEMYSWAIREMVILGRLCPDLEVRFAAVKFLAQEFKPQEPVETEEERERCQAHIEIEALLRARGIAPPEDAPIELETLEEQESEP